MEPEQMVDTANALLNVVTAALVLKACSQLADLLREVSKARAEIRSNGE